MTQIYLYGGVLGPPAVLLGGLLVQNIRDLGGYFALFDPDLPLWGGFGTSGSRFGPIFRSIGTRFGPFLAFWDFLVQNPGNLAQSFSRFWPRPGSVYTYTHIAFYQDVPGA